MADNQVVALYPWKHDNPDSGKELESALVRLRKEYPNSCTSIAVELPANPYMETALRYLKTSNSLALEHLIAMTPSFPEARNMFLFLAKENASGSTLHPFDFDDTSVVGFDVYEKYQETKKLSAAELRAPTLDEAVKYKKILLEGLNLLSSVRHPEMVNNLNKILAENLRRMHKDGLQNGLVPVVTGGVHALELSDLLRGSGINLRFLYEPSRHAILEYGAVTVVRKEKLGEEDRLKIARAMLVDRFVWSRMKGTVEEITDRVAKISDMREANSLFMLIRTEQSKTRQKSY